MQSGISSKNYYFLKVASFALGYALLLGISVLSVYEVNEQTPLMREVLQSHVYKRIQNLAHIPGGLIFAIAFIIGVVLIMKNNNEKKEG